MPAAARPGTKAHAAPAARQIRDYLAALPSEARRVVKQLRGVVRAAAPEAVEIFSYGIPGYRFDGKPLVWCAGWQSHASIYPLTPAMRRALGADLKIYGAGRGTVRFALDEPLPTALVRRLVKARAVEIAAARQARRPARTSPAARHSRAKTGVWKK